MNVSFFLVWLEEKLLRGVNPTRFCYFFTQFLIANRQLLAALFKNMSKFLRGRVAKKDSMNWFFTELYMFLALFLDSLRYFDFINRSTFVEWSEGSGSPLARRIASSL